MQRSRCRGKTLKLSGPTPRALRSLIRDGWRVWTLLRMHSPRKRPQALHTAAIRAQLYRAEMLDPRCRPGPHYIGANSDESGVETAVPTAGTTGVLPKRDSIWVIMSRHSFPEPVSGLRRVIGVVRANDSCSAKRTSRSKPDAAAMCPTYRQ